MSTPPPQICSSFPPEEAAWFKENTDYLQVIEWYWLMPTSGGRSHPIHEICIRKSSFLKLGYVVPEKLPGLPNNDLGKIMTSRYGLKAIKTEAAAAARAKFHATMLNQFKKF